MDVYRVLNW